MKSKIKDKNGKLLKKYRDMPRFPVILKYEKSFTDNFSSLINSMNKDLLKKIDDFIK